MLPRRGAGGMVVKLSLVHGCENRPRLGPLPSCPKSAKYAKPKLCRQLGI